MATIPRTTECLKQDLIGRALPYRERVTDEGREANVGLLKTIDHDCVT
jgi:hypothetical protein